MRISLFLNHRCNLRCGYCYNGEKFNRPMDWEVARRAVDLALSGPRQRSQISFFGGEPLLEMGLMRRIVDYAEKEAQKKERKVRFVVTTNGTLLTGKRLDYLRAHRFHIGVSLDGNREAHDCYRRYPSGRSTHTRVSKNIAQAVERYKALEVIAVMDPKNVHLVDQSFRYIFDLGVRDMTFNMNYEADWDEAAGRRLEESFARLGAAVLEKARQGHHFTVNPLDAKIVTRLKGGYSCDDRCDFGCQELAVSPTGHFYPCERLISTDDNPEVQIGDVWSGVDVKQRDRLRNAKNEVQTDCEGCAVMDRCMFWCGCVNYASTGRVDRVSGTLCWSEQLFIEAADRVAATLYKEQNPVFMERYYLSPISLLPKNEQHRRS
jgi:uncharacterized protein